MGMSSFMQLNKVDVYKRQDYTVDVLIKIVERLRELSPVTGQEGW